MYYITQRQLNDLEKAFSEARLSKMSWSDLGQTQRMWVQALRDQQFSKPKTIIINNLAELQAALMAGIVTGTPEEPLGRQPGEPDDRDHLPLTHPDVSRMMKRAFQDGKAEGIKGFAEAREEWRDSRREAFREGKKQGISQENHRLRELMRKTDRTPSASQLQDHLVEAGMIDANNPTPEAPTDSYRMAYAELLELVYQLKNSRVEEVQRTTPEPANGQSPKVPSMTTWSLWTSKFGRRYPLMALPMSNLLRGVNGIERKYFDR
jgi:hypothetical protein